MKNLKLSGLLLGLCIGLTACNKDQKGETKNSFASGTARFEWNAQTSANAEITIVNQYGEPVQGAQILIGDAEGTPFRNNFVVSDGRGVALIPSEWTAPASVTIAAQGYIRSTLLAQAPGNITVRLNSAYLPQYAEVKGNVTQLPVVNGDGLIDFALAMPVLTKKDLLNFDFSQVISPYTDTLSAAGQTSQVPSNISLPKQSESYFINVTLNKPLYRLKVPTLGAKKFVAVRGRFNFKQVVGELRNGKPFHELINMFSILGSGMHDATITGPATNLDIPGTETAYTSTLQVNTPTAAADEIALVLSTSDMAGNMVPTDVKRSTNGKATALQTIPSSSAYIVNVLKKQAEFMSPNAGSDRMSATILPYSAGTVPKFLPLIANPSVINKENYTITLPALNSVEGVNPIATSAIISELVEVKDGDKTFMNAIHKWEVFGYGWNTQIALPKWPLDPSSNARKRVEVNYVGSSTSKDNNIDNATHVTHASADF